MKNINLRKAIGKILSDSMWSGFIISHLIVIITFAAYAVNRHVAYSKLQSSIIELQKEKISLLEGNNITKPKEKLLKIAELESVELSENTLSRSTENQKQKLLNLGIGIRE